MERAGKTANANNTYPHTKEKWLNPHQQTYRSHSILEHKLLRTDALNVWLALLPNIYAALKETLPFTENIIVYFFLVYVYIYIINFKVQE